MCAATDAPRTKNGQPAHSTTGVASTNWIQARCPVRQGVRKPESARPFPAPRPAASARRRSKSGASCRRVRVGPSSAPPASGLQRHAADRASAGAGLADFRMHRAGVDRATGGELPRATCGLIYLDRRRICCGNPPNRNNRSRSYGMAVVMRLLAGSTCIPHTGSVSIVAGRDCDAQCMPRLRSP